MSAAVATPRRKAVTKKRPSVKAEKPSRGRRGSAGEAGVDYGPLGRPLWSGAISFGLVNIPVRLHAAVREQRVAFHMLHDQDHARLRRRLVNPNSGKEVHPEHVVRGYEVGPDKYVIVRDDELEACSPQKTKTIEITDFVELSEIDPLLFDRPYYVIPQAGASKSYRLLVEAIGRSGRVGLARIVMHEKEHLAALRPFDGLLCVELMHFANEVVPASDIDDLPGDDVDVAERELTAARKIIDDLSGKFDPGEFRDEYRSCIRAMVEKKAKTDGVVGDETEKGEEKSDEQKAPARSAGNLMAALEASLAAAKTQSPAGGGGAKTKRRKRS